MSSFDDIIHQSIDFKSNYSQLIFDWSASGQWFFVSLHSYKTIEFFCKYIKFYKICQQKRGLNILNTNHFKR